MSIEHAKKARIETLIYTMRAAYWWVRHAHESGVRAARKERTHATLRRWRQMYLRADAELDALGVQLSALIPDVRAIDAGDFVATQRRSYDGPYWRCRWKTKKEMRG